MFPPDLLINLLEHFENVIQIRGTACAFPRTEQDCADTALLGSIENQTQELCGFSSLVLTCSDSSPAHHEQPVVQLCLASLE